MDSCITKKEQTRISRRMEQRPRLTEVFKVRCPHARDGKARRVDASAPLPARTERDLSVTFLRNRATCQGTASFPDWSFKKEVG